MKNKVTQICMSYIIF